MNIYYIENMFKTIEIKNLRGIAELKINDLSKINVFVGPNNCGKTTILESIFLLLGISNPQISLLINNLRDLSHSENNDFRFNFRDFNYENIISLKCRDDHDGERYLKITPIFSNQIITKIEQKNYLTNEEPLSTNTFKEAIGLNFDFQKKNDQENYHSELKIDRLNMQVSIDGKYQESLRGIFLNNKTLYSSLVEKIDQIQRTKKKQELIEILKKIDPKVVDIALSHNNLIYVDIGIEQMIPVNLMGDGFKKSCAVISHLLILKDGFLIIDEIENGLHYQALYILWKAIIEASNKFNVQIFLSTHSYEAIKVLIQVIEKNKFDPNDLRLLSIQKLNNNEHKCYNYNFDELEAHINSNVEIR